MQRQFWPDGNQRSQEAARVKQAVRHREEEFTQLEKGHEAATPLFRIQDGQDANVSFVHEGQGFGGGRIRPDALDLGLHDVADLGRYVRDEAWRRHAEGLQHEIDAVVGVTAASRDGRGHAGAPFEFGVADGGTDRVGVRIAMADD